MAVLLEYLLHATRSHGPRFVLSPPQCAKPTCSVCSMATAPHPFDRMTFQITNAPPLLTKCRRASWVFPPTDGGFQVIGHFRPRMKPLNYACLHLCFPWQTCKCVSTPVGMSSDRTWTVRRPRAAFHWPFSHPFCFSFIAPFYSRTTR